jgi:hypothetical protein
MVRTMIKFPEMREELIDRIQLLSDNIYQQSYWGSKVPHLGFNYIIHFFFDDSILSEAPEKCMGYILKNKQEVEFVSDLCKKINHILDVYGSNEPDDLYINTPEWDDLMRKANEFLKYFDDIGVNVSQRKTPQIKFHTVAN